MMPESADIQDLVAVAQWAGRSVLITQGGGGNASVKDVAADRMWIKASGYRLGDLTATAGHVRLRRAELAAAERDPALASLSRERAHAITTRAMMTASEGGSVRPSLESGLHAVMDARVVLHTHPVFVNAFGCLEEGPELLADALGRRLPFADYAAPGYALTVAVDAAVEAFRSVASADDVAAFEAAPVVILRNHGVIVGAETPDAVIAVMDELIAAGRRVFGPLPTDAAGRTAPPPKLLAAAARLQTLYDETPGLDAVVRPAAFPGLLGSALDAVADARQTLLPDDAMLRTEEIPVATAVGDVGPAARTLADPHQPLPHRAVVYLKDVGPIFADQTITMAGILEEFLLAHVLVRGLAAPHGTLRSVPDAELAHLIEMESEGYRERIAAAMSERRAPATR
jgi:ribulose-5-phosphate 4-epimerase/fuculose-1-phosphate aldolase